MNKIITYNGEKYEVVISETNNATYKGMTCKIYKSSQLFEIKFLKRIFTINKLVFVYERAGIYHEYEDLIRNAFIKYSLQSKEQKEENKKVEEWDGVIS